MNTSTLKVAEYHDSKLTIHTIRTEVRDQVAFIDKWNEAYYVPQSGREYLYVRGVCEPVDMNSGRFEDPITPQLLNAALDTRFIEAMSKSSYQGLWRQLWQELVDAIKHPFAILLDKIRNKGNGKS